MYTNPVSGRTNHISKIITVCLKEQFTTAMHYLAEVCDWRPLVITHRNGHASVLSHC